MVKVDGFILCHIRKGLLFWSKCCGASLGASKSAANRIYKCLQISQRHEVVIISTFGCGHVDN